ncbi:hypothetical protein DVH24_006936, partial [Malus domestica]
VQITKLATKCYLEHFGAFLGQDWIVQAWKHEDGRFKGILHKMRQFGAFWSKSERGLNSTCLEHKVWMKLKI